MSKLNPLSKSLAKNQEFFYVLGAFEGDGYYNIKDGKVQIGVIDIDFLEEIKRIFNKYSPETRIKIVKHTEARGNSKAQVRINLCCTKFFNRGYHKLIPKTLEEKRYYLKGLMDAEGSVGITTKKFKGKNGNIYNGKDKWLHLSQKDITKLDTWDSWLNEFGIETNKLYKNDGRSYLDIRKNESIKDYYKEIGFSIKRKQKKLKEIVNNLKKSPLSKEDITKVFEIYNKTNFSATLIGKMFDRTKFAITRRLKFNNLWINKDSKQISANDIDITEGILSRELDFKIPNHRLLKYDIKNIKTSKIKSITFDREEESVDLETIKDSNFFLDNGILSHNSTNGISIGYFIAWLIAGGRMDLGRGEEEGEFINPVVIKKPNKQVNFSTENLCYTPNDLIKKAKDLYDKYGKEQVIIYDECSGLDSKGTMKAINQKLEHFFQTCGSYNHVIIIILPNFFKLNEDIATTRSMFLVDCYSDENWTRGFFDYYGPKDKEWLYFLGKKKIGVGNKYFSQRPSFYGKFGDWIPFDREEYEKLKQEALKKNVFGSREERTREKYWGVLTFLKTNTNLTTKEIAKGVSKLLFREITPVALENDLRNYLRYVEKHQEGGNLPK